MAYSDGSGSPSSNRDDYENYDDSDFDDNNSIDIVSDRHDRVDEFRDRRDVEAESDVEVTTFQCKKFSIDNILGIGKNREKSPVKYDGRSSPRSVKCLDDDKNSVDASDRLSISGNNLIYLIVRIIW